jgi:hypothetical protein
MIKSVYKKQSNIPNIGMGLFANEDIEASELIAEFTGKMKTSKQVKTNWSCVYFDDQHIIECGKSNLASYANDVIDLPTKKRNWLSIIHREDPLYTSYDNKVANAHIYQNHETYKAYLKASVPIKKGEEIYVHYGIQFWLKHEIMLPDSDDDLKTDPIGKGNFMLPNSVFLTESFANYVKIFYPTTTKIIPKTINGIETVTLEDADDNHIFIDMTMLVNAKCVEKIRSAELA